MFKVGNFKKSAERVRRVITQTCQAGLFFCTPKIIYDRVISIDLEMRQYSHFLQNF